MKPIFFFLIAYLYCCTFGVQAQKITVYFADDKQPSPAVLITRKGLRDSTSQKILTDTSGEAFFSESSDDYIYKVQLQGFETIIDTLNAKQPLVFYLKSALIMDDVVITAAFAPEDKEKAVHKVTVISRSKIEAMAAQNLRDVLTNELNIRISQDNILGSSLSLQGISGQNVKILIDGVPVIGRMNGNVDLSQIQLNNIEKIEVVEGPLSVKYGTDALAGTINLITKKTQTEVFSTSAHVFYESMGQYNISSRIGIQRKSHTIGWFIGRNYFDGWIDGEKPFTYQFQTLANENRFKTWKPKEQWFSTLNYSRKIKELNLNYANELFKENIVNRGLPRKPYSETAFDDYYHTFRHNNTLSLSGNIHKNWHTNIIFAYNHFKRIKNTYFKDLTNLQEIQTSNIEDQDTTIFNLLTARGSIAYVPKSAKLNYEIGYDIAYEKSIALRIQNGQQTQGDFALFNSLEYKPWTNLTIRPGIRFIYNTVYKAPVIPSINIRYGLEKHTFRLSYARGFRAPSLKELYFYFVDLNHNIEGNVNLKSENSNNFSFSYIYSASVRSCAWKIEYSAFYNQISHLITLAQKNATIYSYINLEQFKSIGSQIQTEISVQNIKVQMGTAIIGRYNQLIGHEYPEQWMYTPEAKCNLMYTIPKAQLSIQAFYKYTGKMPSIGIDAENNVFKYTMGDYHTADLSINKYLWNKKMVVGIGSKNIFNVKNVKGFASSGTHDSGSGSVSIGLGRTYFIKLDYFFSTKK